MLLLLAGMGIVLAGFWMTATHVPLVLQAMDGEVSWGAALYHTAPGLAVMAVGGFWSARFWADQPDDEPPPD